jgi:hypothetical protein
MELQQTLPAARPEVDLDAETLRLGEIPPGAPGVKVDSTYLTTVFTPSPTHAKDQLHQAPQPDEAEQEGTDAGEGCLECIYNRICEWVQSIIDCLRPLFAGAAAVPVDHTREIFLVREFVLLRCQKRIRDEELPAWMETFKELPEAARWAVMEICVENPDFRRKIYAEFKNREHVHIVNAFGLGSYDVTNVIEWAMSTHLDLLHLDASIALEEWLRNPQFDVPDHAPFTDYHYVREFLQDWNTQTFHTRTPNEFGGDDIGKGWKNTYRVLPEELRQACFDAVLKAHPEMRGKPPATNANEQEKQTYETILHQRVTDYIDFMCQEIEVMKTVTAWEVSHRPAKPKEPEKSDYNAMMDEIQAFLDKQKANEGSHATKQG